MSNKNQQLKSLSDLIKKKKIVTLPELKSALKTNSRMTIFRKLNRLKYVSSYSHGGQYYSLETVTKFNAEGLWSYKSALFSKQRTLLKTVGFFVNESEKGYSAQELEKVLKIRVDGPLLELIKEKMILRKKYGGLWIYFSKDYQLKKEQELFRKYSTEKFSLDEMRPEILMNELKAAIIIFFSLLNEKQRRLYAGLEALKTGKGGDKKIAELLELNVKTIAKGREELLREKIKIDTIREKGGGRKKILKKNTRVTE